jgi:alpha-amylase
MILTKCYCIFPQTCLPQGTYCDIITGDVVDGACTGRTITVGSDGTAELLIYQGDDESVLALHVGARV